MKKPKVLLLDIETSPIIAYVWGLWDQNVALNQIKSDWSIIAWSALWLGDKPNKIMYKDQRNSRDVYNDKKLLKKLWYLLDSSDIIVTQNGRNFDQKKINARFIINGMKPPSTFKHIDTLVLAKKHFGFTSNKLEYMSDKLNKQFKKLVKRDKFNGFELWRECLAGNKKAWKQMEIYNKHDVLALEELYKRLIPWDSNLNFSIYSDSLEHVCSCGSTKLQKKGYAYTASGKYQRYVCLDCGAQSRGKENLLSKEKRQSLKVNIPR